jgi:3-dehydroquinate synthase
VKQILVNAERSYSVDFVNDWRKKLEDSVAGRQVAVLIPSSLLQIAGNLPEEWLTIDLPDGETQKSGLNYLKTLDLLAEAKFNRGSLVVGLGGGATTDLAGFVAATYLRGVEWIAVPTSLAAMVDAAIGGKTGINLESGKNLAGAFHSPSQVIVDENFLSSLPEKDIRAGLAEVAKCGFIADSKILDLIISSWRANLHELISRAISVKALVVGNDFKESYEREILNYGHTLGHAIERHSNYQLRHGECVSIGLIYAGALSEKFSGLTYRDARVHREILESLELPTSYHRNAWPELYELMLRDKKKKSSLRFVTLSEIGRPARLDDPGEELLREIYEKEVGR